MWSESLLRPILVVAVLVVGAECALGEESEEEGILFICSTRFIYAVSESICRSLLLAFQRSEVCVFF